MLTTTLARGSFRAMVLAALSLPMALATALATSAATAAAQTAPSSRPTVAVLYFTNGAISNNADYAPLSKGLAEMMITELSANTNIRVVERDRLQALLEEQNLGASGRVEKETAAKLGKTLGAL
ncbi:MAG: CsgG/HfaB family protein, partial [Gemmatimonadota bacterium]|nr:CsgG/HfaB family protein [Gemmatimonadota bacterium]